MSEESSKIVECYKKSIIKSQKEEIYDESWQETLSDILSKINTHLGISYEEMERIMSQYTYRDKEASLSPIVLHILNNSAPYSPLWVNICTFSLDRGLFDELPFWDTNQLVMTLRSKEDQVSMMTSLWVYNNHEAVGKFLSDEEDFYPKLVAFKESLTEGRKRPLVSEEPEPTTEDPTEDPTEEEVQPEEETKTEVEDEGTV